MKKFFKNNKGFTLIELLVVIAILAVLATLYVPRIMGSAANAKKTVAIANARTLASEITMYNSTAATANLIKGTGEKTGFSASATYDDNTLIVTKDNIEAKDATILYGRDFPDPAIVLLLTDNLGNCFIVQGTGATGHVGEPFEAED